MKQAPNILLIGPVYRPEKGNLGGATRSFQQLVQYFEAQALPHRVIDTQAVGGGLAKLQYVLREVKKHADWAELVFLNTSQNGIRSLGPAVYRLARKHKLKVAIRPFGSAFKELYEQQGFFQKLLLRNTVLKADILFLQTKGLMHFFAPNTRNVQWLPTSRFSPPNELLDGSTTFGNRFVYIGQINSEKAGLALRALSHLNEKEITLHFYGPLADGDADAEKLKSMPNYKGILQADTAVFETLAKYDALVLPSTYIGEGYPGAIIEAFAMGKPVIATNWRYLPELVAHEKNGLLCNPDSVQSLADAMQRLPELAYAAMCANARQTFETQFEANGVMGRMVEQLIEIAQ